jgi:hypothetical protein
VTRWETHPVRNNDSTPDGFLKQRLLNVPQTFAKTPKLMDDDEDDVDESDEDVDADAGMDTNGGRSASNTPCEIIQFLLSIESM